jgi:hypothetical protein
MIQIVVCLSIGVKRIMLNFKQKINVSKTINSCSLCAFDSMWI